MRRQGARERHRHRESSSVFRGPGIKLQAQNAPDAGVLPEAAAVIFDEAHELEDVASSYFGVSLSNMRFEELARDVEMLLRAKQISLQLPERRAQTGAGARAHVFRALPEQECGGRACLRRREEFLETVGRLYLGLMNALHRLEGELEQLRGVEEAPRPEKARCARFASTCDFLMEAEIAEHCLLDGAAQSSGRLRRRRDAIRICRRHRLMFRGCCSDCCLRSIPSVVLTSATLTVQAAFDISASGWA